MLLLKRLRQQNLVQLTAAFPTKAHLGWKLIANFR